jgi:hypothetical protein
MFEIYKGVGRPQPNAEVFAGYQLSRAFQKHRKDQERLSLEPNCAPVTAQFTAPKVNFEAAEPHYARCRVERQSNSPLTG